MQARMIAASENATSRSELAAFLTSLRRRVDPNVRDLGPHRRLPSRVGKRVTQGELAEAIGSSREWYGRLETAAAIRPSTALLDRLANALMVSPEERVRLFHLAVPEMRRPVELRGDSIAMLEAFSRLRSLTKRLYTATSVEDVLSVASEQITDWFEDVVLVHTSRRSLSGVWEAQAVDDKQDQSCASKIIRELEDHVLPTSREIDGLNLYPRLANAGDIGTPELQPLPVQEEVLKLVASRRLPGFTFLKARVRSRSGLVAGFCIIHELGHSYSASDRAALSAVAEVASLALSSSHVTARLDRYVLEHEERLARNLDVEVERCTS
jgi:transcriptional regulator with XRE-family HTH domain